MRLLAERYIRGRTIRVLRAAAGHDAKTVSDVIGIAGLPDEAYPPLIVHADKSHVDWGEVRFDSGHVLPIFGKGPMSRRDKLIDRLKARPRDFTWSELVRLLETLGYVEVAPGKTGGSSMTAFHASGGTHDHASQAAPGKYREAVCDRGAVADTKRRRPLMSTLLEYKGYLGLVGYSDVDEVFHGRLEDIRALITYEATDAKGLRQAFQEAVDDYLALCAEEGREPEVPLKGRFDVEPGRDLHRRAVIVAHRKGVTLDTVVGDVLRQYLDREGIDP